MNKESIAGLSVMQEVTAQHEWCAEAYMETDYSTLTEENFIKNLHAFSSFMFSTGNLVQATKKTYQYTKASLTDRKWTWFRIKALFDIERGERIVKSDRIQGKTPLITANSMNNGVTDAIDYQVFKRSKTAFKEKITIDIFFNTFYHPYQYFSDDNVHTLTPKFTFNRFIALFLVSIFKFNQYKYAYGRQLRINKLMKESIKLPVTQAGKPDWQFMEHYIKSLPYSKNLASKKEALGSSVR